MPPLLTALRDDLVARAIVRKPSVAGALHPLWVEPRQGVPAPGEGSGNEVDSTLVAGAYLTNGVAPQRYESWWRQKIIEFRFRGTDPRAIETLEEQIAAVVIDKVDWTLTGSLYVVESEQFTPLQRLGSDEQSYDYSSSYRFVLYRP